MSEEYQIVQRIKDFVKDEEPPQDYYEMLMLRNGRILHIDDYRKMVNSGGINPRDAYVYIVIDTAKSSAKSKADFHYPFLEWYSDTLDFYLSKLGFHNEDSVVPATGLNYAVELERYEDYLSIELANLDVAVNNTNLPKIVVEVIGKKLISGGKGLTDEEYRKILGVFRSQKLFAGHNFEEAGRIIYEYYDKGNQSLAKEVTRIAKAYVDIFNPYRTCYNMKTWKEIDCWSIKL